MNYEYTCITSDRELTEILSLQGRNLRQALSINETANEGFVTVEHSFDLLKKMNAIAPHIIVKHNNCVVGYALCMDPSFRNDIPILKPMFQELNRLNIYNYIIMGQICIAKAHRKKGVFRSLYSTMTTELRYKYEHIITEVDIVNTRSLNAHNAIGFKTLSTYESNNQNWVILSLSV